MLSIRTNIASLDAQNNLSDTTNSLNTSLQRLSSGYRINSAGDDAAGLGISTKLEASIASYGQAVNNANDGVSIVQSTEAALNDTVNMITRLRELAMESASSGIGNSERAFVATEANSLLSEIDRIAAVSNYNGQSLLSGVSTLSFQVGIGNTANDRIAVSTVDATTSTMGISAIDLSTQTSAQNALTALDAALADVNTAQASLGAAGNRFQDAITTIQAFSQSLSAADSRIRDVDVAQETSNLAQAQIREQAGVSVLAQANQVPQLALKLIG